MASGFNLVDFMDLPPVERCIIRLVLRETSMTYPQLLEAVQTLPPDQQMDHERFDSALDHLTLSEWLVSQKSDQQLRYRVNTLNKTSAQSQGLLDGLDLETLDEARSHRLKLESTPAASPASNHRGKRGLPTHIWDCLTEPVAVHEAPKRRTSLFDQLIDDDSATPEK